MNSENVKEVFTKYITDNFDINDGNIERKLSHSLRVMQLTKNIALYENLNIDDIETCEVIGLLHDYGRFHQVSKYKTFLDHKSVDHGDLAVEFLFDDGDIKNYTNNVKIYDEVYDAIKYHNKLKTPRNLSKHNLKMLYILKDADKIDNLYLWSKGDFPSGFKLKGDKVSDSVIKNFENNELVDVRDIKNDSDYLVTILCFIYDIKSEYAFKYLKEKEIYNNLYNQLPNKEIFKYYFDEINKYLSERC